MVISVIPNVGAITGLGSGTLTDTEEPGVSAIFTFASAMNVREALRLYLRPPPSSLTDFDW
jgi:hypothetical protein